MLFAYVALLESQIAYPDARRPYGDREAWYAA
jgi:hypothetical protein